MTRHFRSLALAFALLTLMLKPDLSFAADPQHYHLPANFVEQSPFSMLTAQSTLVSLRPVSHQTACGDGTKQAVFDDLTILNITLLSKPFPYNIPIGKAVKVTLSVVNCSGTDWASSDVHLGAQDPQDNIMWGANRVQFPPNVTKVPKDHRMTLSFYARAPMQAGTYNLSWGVVHEGVAWLSGNTNAGLTVEFPDESLQPLCPGIDPSIRATPGLGFLEHQVVQCIAETPDNGVLEFTPGVYYITTKIYVNRPMTIRTRGLQNHPYNCLSNTGIDCAIFVAHPRFNAGEDVTANSYNGIFYVGVLTQNYTGGPNGYVSGANGEADPNFGNVNVDHIVIHGNRLNRIGPPIWNWTQENRGWGVNETFSFCNNCSLTFSASVSSLGSSGLQWRGANAILVGNVVRDGGQASITNPGSATINDGMTILDGQGSTIVNNISMNNTDVDLIVSHIQGASIRNNLIYHEASSPTYTFHFSEAGFMLDDFNAPAYNDSTGSDVTANLIVCNGTCRIGMELGPYPWYPGTSLSWSAPAPPPTCINANRIYANAVIGAPIGINISGASVNLINNFVWGSAGLANPQPLCGVSNTPLNYDTSNPSCMSVLTDNYDGAGDPLPQTNSSMRGCI